MCAYRLCYSGCCFFVGDGLVRFSFVWRCAFFRDVGFSLRLGHTRVLTSHCDVIHYARAASLRRPLQKWVRLPFMRRYAIITGRASPSPTKFLPQTTERGTDTPFEPNTPLFLKALGVWARICVANRGLGLPSLILSKSPHENPRPRVPYSSSPFWRMMSLMGVPLKPKVSRRQFSMKRW